MFSLKANFNITAMLCNIDRTVEPFKTKKNLDFVLKLCIIITMNAGKKDILS